MQNDVLDLLSQGMGTSLHWFPEDFSISRLAETLVGMSNASGGVVLIGIAPRSNRLQGVRNSEAAEDRVFQAALMADPPLILPLPLLQVVDKVRILKITVPPGLPHVYNLEGRYLIRESHRTQTIPPTRLRRLLMDRGVEQFETRLPPEAGLDDLDWEQVSAYRETLKFPREASKRSNSPVKHRWRRFSNAGAASAAKRENCAPPTRGYCSSVAIPSNGCPVRRYWRLVSREFRYPMNL